MEKRYYYLIAFLAFVFALTIDQKIAFFMAENRADFLTTIFNFLTLLGTWIVIPFILISIYFWRTKNKKLIVPLWISLLASLAVAYFLKFTVQKPRPETALGIQAAFKETGYSFPSAHATAAYSSLPIIDLLSSKFRWLWHTLAFLIAFSRVYLGVHYLSDVIAGAIIGYSIADFIRKHQNHKFIKKLNFLSR